MLKGKRFIKDEDKSILGVPTDLQQEIFKAYLNRADKIVIIHDPDFLVRMINAYGSQTLGIKPERINGSDWIGNYVDEADRERFRQELSQLLGILSIGPLRNECVLNTLQGKRVFSWQHFAVKRPPGQAKALLSVGEDITRAIEIEKMLSRRNKILQALSLAAEYFLTATPETWERNVIQVLAAIGKARESERVYVCKNRIGDSGELSLSLKYEWKHTGEWHVFQGQEAPWMSYESVGLVRWVETFRNHGVINEQMSLLPEIERQWNVAPHARSLVAIPVFIDEDWWGYVAFEDWQEGRLGSPEEIEALTALAITFGAAIRRKRTEEALAQEKASVEKRVVERTQEVKQEKARLTASIHSLSLGFVMTDLAGTVVLFNHAVNDILGRSDIGWNSALMSERLSGMVDFNETVEQCIREDKEIKIPDLHYNDTFINLYFTPIKMMEDKGQVIGTVMLIEDVTEAKKLQLARDEFFAVAAHELRTPLSAITGNASIILDYFGQVLGKTQVATMVEEILKSSKRLTTLVNEYLDISRLELNKVELKRERFDVSEVLAGVIEELDGHAQQKHLILVNEVRDPLWVFADLGRTQQSLINLIDNAIKYTDLGKITINGKTNSNQVKIRIQDTGKGVSDADQKNLFQKFKQVGDRVYARDASQGTGMGLYISRLLAEAMGGNVYLESSEVGKGSIFVLELPKG